MTPFPHPHRARSPRARRLPRVLQAVASSAALALIGSGLVVGSVQAAPQPTPQPTPQVASPDVTTLTIPSVAATKKTVLKADGLRRSGRVVAALSARSTTTFSTIGVTWARGQKAPQIEVRTRSKGSWTSWQLLEDESTSGPDGVEALKARPGTAPLWVGDSDGVEVRLVTSGTSLDSARSAVPSDVAVSLVDAKTLSSDASAARTAAAAASTTPSIPKLTKQPTVLTRAGWGASESLRSYNGRDCARPRYTGTIRAAIVHHTAGANSYSAASAASQVRGIYAYHVKSQGWCDIGYNFLIDKYGVIYEGRAGGITAPVHGAHATSWNTDTVGVSLMGNFETTRPTQVMLDSAAKVIAWKLESNYRTGTGRVKLGGKNINIIAGHGDVMSTACPGVNMRSRMNDLRNEVTRKIGSFKSPNYKRWQSLGGESGWVGKAYNGETAVGVGRTTHFDSADLHWTAATGSHWIRGGNRSLYRSLGESKSPLGWPIADEEKGVLSSTVNRFQSGAIYRTTATGSIDVYGAFYPAYTRSGASTRLGLPTKSQKTGAVKGSRVQQFQRGGLYWASSLKAQEVNGQIYKAYAKLGAEKSRLGLPTKGDHAVTGGRATVFQKGRIGWKASTNEITVTYT